MKTPDQTDPWEDEFRKRFEHFEAEPPAGALARILMQANAPVPPPATGGRWWRYGAMALIGLLLMITGYLVVNNQPGNVGFRSQPGPALVSKRQILTGEQQAAAGQAQQTNVLAERRVSSAADPEVPATGTSESKRVPGLPNAENQPEIGEQSLPIAQSRVVLSEKKAVRSGKSFRDKVVNGFDNQLIKNDLAFADPVRRIDNKGYRSGTAAPDGIDNIPASGASGPVSPVEATWQNPALAVSTLSGKGLSVNKCPVQLRGIEALASAEPALSKPRQRPVWFASVMPLYTFRQISPNTSDDVYVRQIKTDNGLSGDRAGWRMQAGGEWRLTKWASLRLGITYGHFRQTVQYSVGAAKPDSIIPDLIDDQTLQLTPVIRDVFKTQTTNWQYAGVTADAVWHLGAGKNWTYYATTGASAGGYIGPIRRFSGFYQASFGIERPLTDALWLRIEPTVQYGWNAVSDQKSLFLIRPYMYGLTFGLRY